MRLPPGNWSSQRHWHSHEDEFVYVLEGELTLVEDGGETVLRAGDCAAFPKGTGNGHHLINRSAAMAVYLEVGSRAARRPHHLLRHRHDERQRRRPLRAQGRHALPRALVRSCRTRPVRRPLVGQDQSHINYGRARCRSAPGHRARSHHEQIGTAAIWRPARPSRGRHASPARLRAPRGERHVRTRRPLGRTCCATNPSTPAACVPKPWRRKAHERTLECWRPTIATARSAGGAAAPPPRACSNPSDATCSSLPARQRWRRDDQTNPGRRRPQHCSSGPRQCAGTATASQSAWRARGGRTSGRRRAGPAGQLKVCILSFRLPSACFSNTCVATPPKVAGAPLASLPWIDHLAAATTRSSWPSPTTSSSSSW